MWFLIVGWPKKMKAWNHRLRRLVVIRTVLFQSVNQSNIHEQRNEFLQCKPGCRIQVNIRLKSAKKSKRFRYTQKQNDTQWSKHLQSWGRFQRILKKERPFILEVMWRSQWLVSTWWTRNADSLQNSTSLSETVRRIHLWGHVQWCMSVF